MQHDRYVKEQLEYYKERASEYDEWFLRQGRYDQGKEHSETWFKEVAELQTNLASLKPLGKVLELACGTGWWTEQLIQNARSIVAIDASSEVIQLNKLRTNSPKLSYLQADLFEWQPTERYDFIFFSFWLSHVPPERFEAFWKKLEAALAPKGCVFLIDSVYKQESTAKDQVLPPQDGSVAKRKLNDGREFEIIKIFYEPKRLAQRLEPLGWRVKASQTENFFVYAEARRA